MLPIDKKLWWFNSRDVSKLKFSIATLTFQTIVARLWNFSQPSPFLLRERSKQRANAFIWSIRDNSVTFRWTRPEFDSSRNATPWTRENDERKNRAKEARWLEFAGNSLGYPRLKISAVRQPRNRVTRSSHESLIPQPHEHRSARSASLNASALFLCSSKIVCTYMPKIVRSRFYNT